MSGDKKHCARCGKPVKKGKERRRGYVCVKCRASHVSKMRHGGKDAAHWDGLAQRVANGLA